MDNINWQHLVTRRLAVQVAIAWNYGFGSLFNKKYRTGINNTLVYYNGKKTDYFIDAQELKKFNEDLDKLLDDPKIVASLMPEAKKFVEETYELIRNLIKDADKLSDKELAKLFSRFSEHHANYYTRMWMVFRICERIVIKLESMLKEVINDENEVKELSRIFSIPLVPNDVTNERIDLLKLALKQNKVEEERLRQLLNKHAKKYQHIPMYDFDHEPYSVGHFAEELDSVADPEKELEKIEVSFKERKKEFDAILKKLKPKPELKNLINMLKDAVFLRDYRDMIRQKLNLTIMEFYQEIGLRLGLNVKEVALLTNQEIELHLQNSEQFDKEEIKKRKKSFLLLQFKDKIDIYSGDNADKKATELGLYKKTIKTNTIKGRPASPGRISGKAKIIHTNLDFDKLNEGDILVAAMTRQDFVSVMRKVSAIVTNEGGVTSHAAIIARELGLPCVVGTHIATEIFNDGDFIEVDADKGIVRKIRDAENSNL
ncbi:MAG: PEP-utilizing enzyme [Nanoarchaeota archaeon]|nr:PEP-utilizing enzyme [Nanoarchaeota archaeon]